MDKRQKPDGEENKSPTTPDVTIIVPEPSELAPAAVLASEPAAATTTIVPERATAASDQEEEGKEEEEEEEEPEEPEYLAQEDLGSYSGVHSLRRKWVDAAIKWCEAQGGMAGRIYMLTSWKQDMKGQRERIKKLFGLDDWMSNSLGGGFDPEGGINYDKIPALKYSRSDGPARLVAMETGLSEDLIGLYHFVHHSDCDGEYTSKECERIRRTYDLLREHFEDDNTREDFDQIMKVVDVSVREQLPLVFC